MQAIVTNFIPSTSFQGSRIKATAEAGSIITAWDYTKKVEENHKSAAEELRSKFGWGGYGEIYGGDLANGDMCWVIVPRPLNGVSNDVGTVHFLDESAKIVLDTTTKQRYSLFMEETPMTTTLPESILTENQVKTFGPKLIATVYGPGAMITANVRYDDQCGNGHNTFAITADVVTPRSKRRNDIEAGGCLHDDVAKKFPELAPFIKFHLVSTDGPMHYIANTVYHVEQGNLDYARSSAVWPDATDEDLTAPGLKARLENRLPALMEEFHAAVVSLGFVY